MWQSLWINANLATMEAGGVLYGAIENGALGVDDGRIVWAGRMSDLTGRPDALAKEVHDVDGRWITPGLIDCHTHIVYGGNRAREFEMRLEGASYEDIARAGGGIISTVKATRETDEAALAAAAARRLESFLAEGVTVIEIKSGYGLDLETELKMLRVARSLAKDHAIEIKTTFLGAHTLPPEFADRADAYIDLICEEVMPEVAELGLADAVDAFCEGIGFSPEQTARVFDKAVSLGLPVKLHADQLSDLDGAALAARYGARSADHLEFTNVEGVKAMAAAGTVAVLLPGAYYFLRETNLPPIESFREHGVPMALATDSNPGSSPAQSLLLMMNMGCTLFRMTPEEVLAGITRNAAMALGMEKSHGTLSAGKAADFVVWNIESPAELAYRFGANPRHLAVQAGHVSTN
jgi:imidazolonepropionase